LADAAFAVGRLLVLQEELETGKEGVWDVEVYFFVYFLLLF
jgi:hypothetical protein